MSTATHESWITTTFLNSLENLSCQCRFGNNQCVLCRALENDQGAAVVAVLGPEYLRDFVLSRDQKSAQLTERAELLTFAVNQPELMQLLEDINLSPHTTEHGSNDRVRMNRIIQAWRDWK